MEEGQHPQHPRTEETIQGLFPDRGEFPGNRMTVDPDAPPAPNVGHPK